MHHTHVIAYVLSPPVSSRAPGKQLMAYSPVQYTMHMSECLRMSAIKGHVVKSLYLSVSSKDATGNKALGIHAESRHACQQATRPYRGQKATATQTPAHHPAFPPHTLSCSRKGMWDS